jgi:hypothetical protein
VIRIHKGRTPASLRERGPQETKCLCDQYDAAPAKYASGELTFEFKGEVYGAEEIKTALRNAQHDKCAFCEARVSHIAYGDVEHFRPKAGHVQREGGTLQRPGYYWLAYKWSNLFFACQLCNQRFKRNLFPLRNPAKRARSHHDKLSGERPLLINPGITVPASHVGFREEIAFPVRGSRQGQATIDVLGLNREEMVEARLNHLRIVQTLRTTCLLVRQHLERGVMSSSLREHLAECEARLESCTQDRAEYAAMTRAALR